MPIMRLSFAVLPLDGTLLTSTTASPTSHLFMSLLCSSTPNIASDISMRIGGRAGLIRLLKVQGLFGRSAMQTLRLRCLKQYKHLSSRRSPLSSRSRRSVSIDSNCSQKTSMITSSTASKSLRLQQSLGGWNRLRGERIHRSRRWQPTSYKLKRCVLSRSECSQWHGGQSHGTEQAYQPQWSSRWSARRAK